MTKICSLCGHNSIERALDRHHVCYDPEIIIRICRKCHSKIHQKELQKWRKELKKQFKIPKPTKEDLIKMFPSKRFLLDDSKP